MTRSSQVGILILVKGISYLLSLNELGEKMQATINLSKFVNKP